MWEKSWWRNWGGGAWIDIAHGMFSALRRQCAKYPPSSACNPASGPAMARLARVVVPGPPHHAAQRGNRRERVFFSDDDDRVHRDLIASAARRPGTAVWACRLTPNPVHFIITPSDPDGLRRTFAEAHRRHTARIHARRGRSGHPWRGRRPHFPLSGLGGRSV